MFGWLIKVKTKTKLRGLSPQANYTDKLSDCRLSAKLVLTLADRGCRVVSTTILMGIQHADLLPHFTGRHTPSS
jgi:hypothetical protein